MPLPLAHVEIGDCVEVLKRVPDGFFDAVVTDPPYHLTQASRAGSPRKPGTEPFGRTHLGEKGFMGTTWDGGCVAFRVDLWREVLRILKPGAHLIAFGGTRTWHRLACAIENAGFEIRDSLAWLYATGWPKQKGQLKPAFEPLVVARKPFVGSCVANLEAHGTGHLNTEACRLATNDDLNGGVYATASIERDQMWGGEAGNSWKRGSERAGGFVQPSGRWPANVLLSHDERCVQVGMTISRGNAQHGQDRGVRPPGLGDVGSPNGDGRPAGALHEDMEVPLFACVPGCPVRALDDQAGKRRSGRLEPYHRRKVARMGRGGVYGDDDGDPESASKGRTFGGDEGGPSRFFYTTKAGASERFGLVRCGCRTDVLLVKSARAGRGTTCRTCGTERVVVEHPTVKPIALMEWLVRLACPSEGVVLDPFAGTGSTGVAAISQGFDFVGIEQDPDYAKIARWRVASACDGVEPDHG